MKYLFNKDMREISGFGGSYEKQCQKMVVAGLEWCDKNLNAEIKYKEFLNLYGVITDKNKHCRVMQKAMLKPVKEYGVTGAMMQASLSHIMYIRRHGWDKYVKEMQRLKENE